MSGKDPAIAGRLAQFTQSVVEVVVVVWYRGRSAGLWKRTRRRTGGWGGGGFVARNILIWSGFASDFRAPRGTAGEA